MAFNVALSAKIQIKLRIATGQQFRNMTLKGNVLQFTHLFQPAFGYVAGGKIILICDWCISCGNGTLAAKNSSWKVCVQSIDHIFILVSFNALRNGGE